jgi:DNA polymerase III epsilon subunit-like protein
MIQLCAIHLSSGETFARFVNWGEDLNLVPENTSLHNITKEKITKEGHSPLSVATLFMEWVEKKAEGKKIVMIAHNVGFDYETLRKFFYTTLGRSFGPGGVDLGWAMFDTCAAAREIHPEQLMKYWPWEKPYSLGTLISGLLGMHKENLHDAERDVEVLCRLFKEKILPKLPELVGGEWYKCSYFLPISNPADLRLKKVSKVSGVGNGGRVWMLTEEINNAFDLCTISGYKQHRTAPGLLTIAHLIIYGMMRWRQMLDQKRKIAEPFSPEDDNQWWWVCKAVETLLRSLPFGFAVYSDITLANVISAVCGRDVLDLTTHTMREDGNKRFFPCCWGEKIAWSAMKLDEDDVRRVVKETGWGTVNEMYADYTSSPITLRASLVTNLNNCLFQKRDPEKLANEILQVSKRF